MNKSDLEPAKISKNLYAFSFYYFSPVSVLREIFSIDLETNKDLNVGGGSTMHPFKTGFLLKIKYIYKTFSFKGSSFDINMTFPNKSGEEY